MMNVVFLKWDFNFSELSKQSPFEKSYFSPDFLFPLKFPSSSLWIPVKEHCQVEFFNIFTFCLQLNFAINNKPSNSISIDVLSTLKCFVLFKMVERQKFKLLTFQKVFPSDPSKGVCWILWKAKSHHANIQHSFVIVIIRKNTFGCYHNNSKYSG